MQVVTDSKHIQASSQPFTTIYPERRKQISTKTALGQLIGATMLPLIYYSKLLSYAIDMRNK